MTRVVSLWDLLPRRQKICEVFCTTKVKYMLLLDAAEKHRHFHRFDYLECHRSMFTSVKLLLGTIVWILSLEARIYNFEGKAKVNNINLQFRFLFEL